MFKALNEPHINDVLKKESKNKKDKKNAIQLQKNKQKKSDTASKK